MTDKRKEELVLWFKDISNDDVELVGGKNASLGEMYCELGSKGIEVPNGFAITAKAYRYFLKEANIEDKIKEVLDGLKQGDTKDLRKRGREVRRLILSAQLPSDLEETICEHYKRLGKEYEETDIDVAVRSSATAEDLPGASFAGQQDTYLNISGEGELLSACKRCMASLFNDRAINYRIDKGFDHMQVALSICVQRMARSDKACSGVTFTIDTESGFKDVVLITAAWGLGENVVQGAVNPDEFLVFKVTMNNGCKPIIQKKLGSKEMTMVYHPSKPTTKNLTTDREKRDMFCLNDDEIMQLAKWACIIEDHYSKKNGKHTPMDIEWAKDGVLDQMFVVQARPETVQSQKDITKFHTYKLLEKGKVLCKGTSVGMSVAQGKARVLKSVDQIHDFKQGEVLITEMTDPDWEPILKHAKAIITNRGGRTCHAAIISRELGIPCVVGCGCATQVVKTGQQVTVDCSSGDAGVVYDGTLKFEEEEHTIEATKGLKTKICMNLANPETAFHLRAIPSDGVGLVRMEFIIGNHIKAHPMALLCPKKVESKQERKELKQLIKPYKNGEEFFVEKLAQGIGVIAAAFFPKRVILRFSDFKTDEYAGLLGGKTFEPKEDNPMLGWRGASRYYDPDYKDGFSLECKAIKKIREEYGLWNLSVMIPFCRTVKEAELVIQEMEKNGLKREGSGEKRLQIMGMCEIPSNVILAKQFLHILDGKVLSLSLSLSLSGNLFHPHAIFPMQVTASDRMT
ncbi:Phosphoenolpyruvate synthase, variant 2 [Balamuthia mandrillaris]